MKKLNVAALIIGICMVLAVWMPMASTPTGSVYADLTHMTGFSQLVYVFPFLTIVVAITALYRPALSSAWWYYGISITGLAVTALTVWIAMRQVLAFAGFGSRTRGVAVEIGLGGAGIMVGLLLIGAIGWLMMGRSRKASQSDINSKTSI
nr:hypothetical protein [uncultured Halomonas sp.]